MAQGRKYLGPRGDTEDALSTYGGDPMALAPPSGWNVQPPGLLGSGASTQTTSTKGLLRMYPHTIGPIGWTCDQAQILMSNTPSGGTAVAFNVAIFGDDGTSQPDFVTGPLRTAAFTTFSNGAKTQAWAQGSIDLKPGLYWIMTFYYYTGAPATHVGLICNANSTWQLGMPTATGYGPPRGYESAVATYTSLPAAASGLTLTANFVINGSSTIPIVLLHRA